MTELPSCEVCGSTSYIKASGFYVCAGCDTQSQEIQEQLFEQTENARVNDEEEREEIISVYVEENKPLTSWECFNLILRGLVNDLRQLGASPDLKIVAFQLWACYLQKANVAFFSKQNEKLPSLPLGFRTKDVEILYGIPNLRRTLFKDYFRKRKKDVVKNNLEQSLDELVDTDTSSSSNVSNVSLLSLRNLRRKQRKLAMNELNESSSAVGESIVSHNDSLQTLGSHSSTTFQGRSKGRKRLKISFKTSTQIALNELIGHMKSLKNCEDEDTMARVRRKISRKMFDSKRNVKVEGNMAVNMTTLISILRIALKLIGDEILLGDILRWIGEGRLKSMNRLEKCFPTHEYGSKIFELQFCSRRGFQMDVRNFTKLINLKDVPTPNLYKLVQRYCVDLGLPKDFVGYVHGIMNFVPPEMNYARHNFRIFPEYELRALGYIIVALKMLFSLDGLTEIHQSEFAESVNRCRTENSTIPSLFSWKQWIKYVECRKAILARYDPLINDNTYGGRINNDEVFLKYWNKMKSSNEVKYERINPVFISTSDSIFDELVDKDIDNHYPDIEFPASLTPNYSNLSYLLQNHSSLVPERARDLLQTEFTDHSVKYIVDDVWCREIADKCAFEVDFVSGLAQVEICTYEPVEEDVPIVSKTSTIPAHVSTYVDVIDESVDDRRREPKNKLKLPKCKKFDFDFKCFESSETEEQMQEQQDLAQQQRPRFNIYRPMKDYWFFHNVHRRITNEEFNELAEKCFSQTFRWLLKECASMIKTDLTALYLEVVHVESVLFGFTVDGEEYAVECPIQLYANEW